MILKPGQLPQCEQDGISLGWRSIPITLKIPPAGVLSEMAWLRQLIAHVDFRFGVRATRGKMQESVTEAPA